MSSREIPSPLRAPGIAGGAFAFRGAAGGTALLVMHLLAPVGLAAAAAAAFARASGCGLDPAGLGALTCGVGAAYLVDRLREADGRSLRQVLMARNRPVLLAVAGAFVAGLGLVVLAEPSRLPVLAVLSVATVSYPVLARVPGGKTAALVAAWVLGCAVLPLPAGAAPNRALMAGFGLLVAAAGTLCDVKDLESDTASGAWSVATWAGSAGARVAAALLALLAVATGVACGLRVLEAGGLAVLLLAALPRVLGHELLGSLAVDLALAAALLVR